MSRQLVSDAQAKVITNSVISMIQSNNTVPWQMPWNAIGVINYTTYLAKIGKYESPQECIDKEGYKGINRMFLSWLPFESPFFLTENQIKELGGTLTVDRKEGFPIWFFSMVQKKDKETGEPIEGESFPVFKFYFVFNAEQISGIEFPQIQRTNEHKEQIWDIESFLVDPKLPKVEYNGSKAAYNPVKDTILLPHKQAFESVESFYATWFHECVHSTGHSKRLNRKGVANMSFFGSHDYSYEELIAELGSTFLCSHFSIDKEQEENHAAYIASWLKNLANNPHWIIDASREALKAYRFIVNESEE